MKAQHIAVVLFYWRNSIFSRKGNERFNYMAWLIVFIITALWGVVNLILVGYWDAIYLAYLLIGVIGTIAMLVKAFIPAWNAHQSLLKDTHFKTIHEYHINRGF